jgi:hypothetical protein
MKLWWRSYSRRFETTSMVCRADSEDEARRIARARYAEEYHYRNPASFDGWLDPQLRECIELIGDGESGVVIAGWR